MWPGAIAGSFAEQVYKSEEKRYSFEKFVFKKLLIRKNVGDNIVNEIQSDIVTQSPPPIFSSSCTATL